MKVTNHCPPSYCATCTSARWRKYVPGASGALIEFPFLSKNPTLVASTQSVMVTNAGSTLVTMGCKVTDPVAYCPSCAVPAKLRRRLDFTGSVAHWAASVDQSFPGSAYD